MRTRADGMDPNGDGDFDRRRTAMSSEEPTAAADTSSVDSSDVDPSPPTEVLRCPRCGRSFMTENGYVVHWADKHIGETEVSSCFMSSWFKLFILDDNYFCHALWTDDARVGSPPTYLATSTKPHPGRGPQNGGHFVYRNGYELSWMELDDDVGFKLSGISVDPEVMDFFRAYDVAEYAYTIAEIGDNLTNGCPPPDEAGIPRWPFDHVEDFYEFRNNHPVVYAVPGTTIDNAEGSESEESHDSTRGPGRPRPADAPLTDEDKWRMDRFCHVPYLVDMLEEDHELKNFSLEHHVAQMNHETLSYMLSVPDISYIYTSGDEVDLTVLCPPLTTDPLYVGHLRHTDFDERNYQKRCVYLLADDSARDISHLTWTPARMLEKGARVIFLNENRMRERGEVYSVRGGGLAEVFSGDRGRLVIVDGAYPVSPVSDPVRGLPMQVMKFASSFEIQPEFLGTARLNFSVVGRINYAIVLRNEFGDQVLAEPFPLRKIDGPEECYASLWTFPPPPWMGGRGDAGDAQVETPTGADERDRGEDGVEEAVGATCAERGDGGDEAQREDEVSR